MTRLRDSHRYLILRKINSEALARVTHKRKRQSPIKSNILAGKRGVALVVTLAVLLLLVWWWRSGGGDNQWTYLAQYGIRLPLRYPVHGIDVSHHNATVDWDRIKKSNQESAVRVDFVFIKATEGATHIDRQFERNWSGAFKAGIRRGAYHFYNPRVLSGRQADNFIRKVSLREGDLPPVLDLEVHANKPDDIIIMGVRNWLTIIEKHYGVKPIIYVNEHFYKKYIAGNFDDYPLWMAGYSRTHLDDLAEDAHVLLWQHSEKGWVPGIKGFVDFNVFLHKTEDWSRL